MPIRNCREFSKFVSIQVQLPVTSISIQITVLYLCNVMGQCQFGIKNGTTQGSVLSPAFFNVYIDDLLTELKNSGVGCNIGGRFFGTAGYVDDTLLLAHLAPCRSAMAQMIKICEEYGTVNSLKFSTDPRPAKSKTK